jgi:hypothetical protein
MAYNFLGLVNDVNARLNEVELTSANFANAKGFYRQAKEAVNTAIMDIQQQQFEWPFNYVEQPEFLSVGVTRYAFPSDARTVDMDSFRIKFDDTLDSDTIKLKVLNYDEYLEKYVDQEYNTDTSLQGPPQYVFRTPGLEYGVVPAPDKAYEIVYEYYRLNVSLINATDVPAIPEIYRHVIIEGAMYYAYLFRSNEQAAVIAKDKFEKGIKNMRTILINRYDYVRSTALNRPQRGNYVYRIKNV